MAKDFHGGGYYYGRNNWLNANDFFNNRNGVKRPVYRYNTFGGTLGGPIHIPGKWNQDRTKLFGFYNLAQPESRRAFHKIFENRISPALDALKVRPAVAQARITLSNAARNLAMSASLPTETRSI